jgi:hypothetical protein
MGPFSILSLILVALPIQQAEQPIESSAQSSVDHTNAAPINIAIAIPRRSSVGSKKAGLVCLPQGRFKIEDFVASEAYLRTVLLKSFAQRSGAQSQIWPASIILIEVKVSLCAKDHLFNGDLYSGDAKLTFEVVSQHGLKTKHVVALKIEKSQARSELEILELAVDRLAEIVMDQGHLADPATPAPAQ